MTTAATFGLTFDSERELLRVCRGRNAVDMRLLVNPRRLPDDLDALACEMGAALSASPPPPVSNGMINALPLVRDLPVEILAEVFLHSHRAAVAARDLSRPLRLSQVCRHFRQAAFISPQLWRNITIDDQHSTSASNTAGWLALWLRNSGACSLSATLRIREDPAAFVRTVLPVLRGHTHRLRKLKLVLTDSPAAVHIWSALVRSPYLDYLKVSVDPMLVRKFAHLTDCSSVAGVITSPNQRLASLPLPLIPPSSAFDQPLSQMIYLKLHECQYDRPTTAARVLDFLALCPALQMLDFCGAAVDVGRSARSVISLPALRIVHLSETVLARDLLSNMHMPALQELHLRQLNVAWTGHDGFFEDGDSDDEAHDFSRSPYSDRLTGMMMRSVLSRCNPPLRVLDFDYVDMRTKDFLWCFLHLPFLEEFRIVASDMSNNVIAALGQPDANGVWPIPRLRTLVLRECNLIRSKFVAGMIVARSSANLLPAHYDLTRCEEVEWQAVSSALETAGALTIKGLSVHVEDVPPRIDEELHDAIQVLDADQD